MSGVDALLRQSHGHAPDLLDRPADQSTGRRALVFVFGGGRWFAWWRTAAIMAKASITSETCRCQPCQDRVLVVSKSQLRLGGLERVLDRPAPPLNAHKCLDRCPGRAPGREI